MEEKVVFDLEYKNLTEEYIKELVDNPSIYGDLLVQLLQHLLTGVGEKSVNDFFYEEEDFIFMLRYA